jgi:hypothetical protein
VDNLWSELLQERGCALSEALREHTFLMRWQSGYEVEKSQLRFGAKIWGFSRPSGAKKALDKSNKKE